MCIRDSLVVAEVLVVRSFFGLFVVGLFAAGSLAFGIRAKGPLCQVALLFVAVQLALSVFSRGDYLFTDTARTGSGTMPSDVANMASALFLPYWFWGLLCGGISVLVLLAGLWVFLVGALPRRGSPLRRRRPA